MEGNEGKEERKKTRKERKAGMKAERQRQTLTLKK